MSIIVSLRGEPIKPRGEANSDLVEDLEKILEMAKSGEISGIAYALIYCDDVTSYQWVGRMTRSVIGTLELIKYGLCRGDWDEQ